MRCWIVTETKSRPRSEDTEKSSKLVYTARIRLAVSVWPQKRSVRAFSTLHMIKFASWMVTVTWIVCFRDALGQKLNVKYILARWPQIQPDVKPVSTQSLLDHRGPAIWDGPGSHAEMCEKGCSRMFILEFKCTSILP